MIKETQIVKNEQIDEVKWLELFQKAKTSSIFQHPDFYRFLCHSEYEATVMAIQKDHELTALMTVFIQSSKGWKRFFTRRGIVFGGPIFSDVKSGRELMQAVWNELKSELIYIESRNLFDFSDLEMEKSVSQWKFLPWKNYWVPLQQGESPMKIMSESRRRQIKKALKIGVTWREAQTQREVSDLYDILENLYKNKVKKPLLSLEFFNKMFHERWSKILVVEYQDKIIGGMICPILEGSTIYEWYVCGLDEEYRDCYPSAVATWAAIEWGHLNNCQYFDFMGAGPSLESYGVREFKARFGGTEMEPGRFLAIGKPVLYRLGKWVIQIMSKWKK